jgi:hypothetical protein
MTRRGWSRMDTNEKLEALKTDLDQLYDMVAANEKTLKTLIEHVDRSLKQLSDELYALKKQTS